MVSGFPISALIDVSFCVVAGSALGTAVGLLSGLALRRSLRVWKDAAVGACGMVVGFVIAQLPLWPVRTSTYKIGEDTFTYTSNMYHHPYRLAFALCLAVSVIRALLSSRLNFSKASPDSR